MLFLPEVDRKHPLDLIQEKIPQVVCQLEIAIFDIMPSGQHASLAVTRVCCQPAQLLDEDNQSFRRALPLGATPDTFITVW